MALSRAHTFAKAADVAIVTTKQTHIVPYGISFGPCITVTLALT